jgi:hypothetical protein
MSVSSSVIPPSFQSVAERRTLIGLSAGHIGCVPGGMRKMMASPTSWTLLSATGAQSLSPQQR